MPGAPASACTCGAGGGAEALEDALPLPKAVARSIWPARGEVALRDAAARLRSRVCWRAERWTPICPEGPGLGWIPSRVRSLTQPARSGRSAQATAPSPERGRRRWPAVQDWARNRFPVRLQPARNCLGRRSELNGGRRQRRRLTVPGNNALRQGQSVILILEVQPLRLRGRPGRCLDGRCRWWCWCQRAKPRHRGGGAGRNPTPDVAAQDTKWKRPNRAACNKCRRKQAE